MFTFRKTETADLPQVMAIIKEAQIYFKENQIDQWQHNYPNLETIQNDIVQDHSYVLVHKQQIIATAAVSFDGEKTYNQIQQGEWLTQNPYAVIHRLAVANSFKGQGVFTSILNPIEKLCCEQGIFSIKIDTHEHNLSMQRSLKKNGFSYCGVIYLEDGSKRVAWEKIL